MRVGAHEFERLDRKALPKGTSLRGLVRSDLVLRCMYAIPEALS